MCPRVQFLAKDEHMRLRAPGFPLGDHLHHLWFSRGGLHQLRRQRSWSSTRLAYQRAASWPMGKSAFGRGVRPLRAVAAHYTPMQAILIILLITVPWLNPF